MKKLFTLAALLLAASAMNAQYITKALNENDESTFKWENASNFIMLSVGDAEREAMEGKILADYNIDDANVWMYIWPNGETYAGGDGTGMNSFGQLENHIALVVTNQGWSGGGIVRPAGADLSMIDDTYVLHFGIKGKPNDNATHGFRVGKAEFSIGPTPFIDNGNSLKLLGDFERNGEWYYVDIPFSVLKQCAADGKPFSNDGGPAAYTGNILAFLSGGVQGTELHLDNIFFYKDATIVPEEHDYVLHYGTEGSEWQDVTFVPGEGDNEGKLVATNVEFAANTEFKVNYGDVWYGGVTPDDYYLIHSEWFENIPLDATGSNFHINEAGTYTFVLDVAEDGIKMTVTGWPEPVEPDYVLHYGHEGVDWQDVTFVPGEGDNEGKLVAADVAFDAGTEFGVKYGETWYAGLPNEGEDNYVIHYGWCTDVPLSTGDNVKNFIINDAGTYTFLLTVGEENITMTVNGFTAPGVLGDVTGDGEVDIADVNAIINIMLQKNPASDYPGNADVTSDGSVDIADVNAVINIMLGK